jgi:tetratricopeptide (TPR) repeat protein
VLQDSGVDITPQALVPEVYLPGRHGSLAVEIQAAARRHGRIAYVLPGRLDVVLDEIDAGRPVLVFQNLGLSWYQKWHYAVVVGYDLAGKRLILRSGRIERYAVKLKVFERTWARSGHWALVVLEPGELPVHADETVYFQSVAAFERNAATEAVAEAYQAGLSRWPRSRLLGIGLSNLHYRRGNREAARALLTQLVRAHPDFAVAHNNLAQVLSELGDYETARGHALRAVALGGPDVELFRETLADIERLMDR